MAKKKANKKAKKDKTDKKDKKPKKTQSSKGAAATEEVVAQPPSSRGKKT